MTEPAASHKADPSRADPVDGTGRVLITGASGRIGRMLRARLRRPGRILRLLDVAPPAPPEPGEAIEPVVGSVTDEAVLAAACRNVDAVIHLAGLPNEASWAEILATNVDGGHRVLEAAARAGIGRVVLASSNHAVGRYSRDDDPGGGLPADLPPRPDGLYGWSKTAIESLGRLYADTYPMSVICLRIGSCFPTPPTVRALATWLSPGDAGRLFEAALTAPAPGYRLVWGISRNTRRWWSLREGEGIGYHPVDDAERYAAALIAEYGEPDPASAGYQRVGGRADGTVREALAI